MSVDFASLSQRLAHCLIADRRPLERRLSGLRRRAAEGKPVDRGLGDLAQAIEASAARLAARRARVPRPTYPESLPVSARREEIAAAIAAHQVVVIAGETGSGKTTQIPKICLELGRGTAGLIGHTQPRRIAARSVAARIAEELGTPLGQAVGYKVRFADRVSEHTLVKLLTDGMLLAEVQGDPLLEQYDTLIIDEAHERSLNIDFLLGYLKRLLPRRPDLKLIITSATINTESFSRYFDGAPVIEVSGRTWPVEIRYRPLAGDEDERDRSQVDAVVDAVTELTAIDPLGDILVFLAGEREIRETAEALRKQPLKHTEILPLFSRLSAAEQDRVFKPHGGRRIVLATNVAETSLTVPGIRFVIDPGFARFSRYSHRTKVQRLPIEPVAQAAANQRAGRCGRVGPGVCIRLYAEEDFLGRPAFTEPEILRTNLASVILQMAALGLGDPESFPFMDPPDRRYINDGYRLLQELHAVDAQRRVTEIGRRLARLPIDPRLGRMLIAADQERSLEEVMIIASALSIQDPRERPMEAQQAADQAHARFNEDKDAEDGRPAPRSDFLAFVRLWRYFHEQARHLSQNKLRKLCKSEFLSYVRLREWHEIHGQLAALAEEMKLRVNHEPADYGAIHRAVLTGLLGHVAVRTEVEEEKKPAKGRRRAPAEYLGARNLKLTLFPGSSLAKHPPKWIMAAELVETARLFARTAAAIEPEWIERLAPHLLKRTWFEPHWEKKPARVAAYEQATLYGLIVVARRPVNYGPIDPQTSRAIFIREGLVAGELRTNAPFFAHNRRLIAEVEELEAKRRRRDLLVDEQFLLDFYDARVPQGVYDGDSFERWRREAERENPRLLFLSREDLMRQEAEGITGEQFPSVLDLDGVPLALVYHFAPGEPDDGVTATVPVAVLAQLDAARLEWLVPGLLEEKMAALIRSLPKALRRNFVPAPNFARALMERLRPDGRGLREAMAVELQRMTGVAIPREAWQEQELPAHLRMNLRVVDEKGRELATGRDLEALRAQLAGKVQAAFEAAPFSAMEQTGLIAWTFGELAPEVSLQRHGLTLRAYPALVDEGAGVALRFMQSSAEARAATAAGLRRLFMLALPDKVKYLKKSLPGLQAMCLHYAPVGRCDDLKDDLVQAAFDSTFMAEPWPRTNEQFRARLEEKKARLVSEATTLAAHVAEALAEYHAVCGLLRREGPHRLHALEDVRGQLAHLIYPGFITRTPQAWRAHLPRYLKAARLRLEKLDRNPERDRQATRDIAALWEPLRRGLEAGEAPDEAKLEFRWLLEELRVSLFAQELRTAVPVSAARLEKRWCELAGA
ncbi:MAG: ATP-dependent RNA helicase HrpA [Thiohalomonadaceae bacterium]